MLIFQMYFLYEGILKDGFGDATEQVLHQVLRLLNHVIQDNSALQENACLIGLVSLPRKDLQHILAGLPFFVWKYQSCNLYASHKQLFTDAY
jgi:hypothetical protein